MGSTDYDIATKQWGKKWRMPNRKHWNELINKCQWVLEKRYHVMGYRVIGPNGKDIFLPVTGIRFEDNVSNTDFGYYWTSELAEDDRSCAYFYCFGIDSKNDNVDTRNYVYSGRAVRPICNK